MHNNNLKKHGSYDMEVTKKIRLATLDFSFSRFMSEVQIMVEL